MSKIPNNPENLAKMILVGEDLLGTCQSVEDALQKQFGEDVELHDFETSLLEELDDQTMCCEECGWWCETGFLNDEQVCIECCPDKEDDDG